MADWVVCPNCQLKHTLRPNGACPRCKEPVGDAAEAAPSPVPPPATASAFTAPPARSHGFAGALPPTATAASPYRPPASSPEASPERGGFITLGGADAEAGANLVLPQSARLAGGILILNGLFVLLEKALAPSQGGGPLSSPISMFVDFGVGGMLVAGRGEALGFAKFRVVAGGLLLPILHLVAANWLLAAFQGVFSVSLILLLFGTPGTARLCAGLAGAGLCLGLEALGLAGLAYGGRNPAAVAQAGSQPVTLVQGEEYGYKLTAPGGHWYLRKDEAARKDNPLADRWIVRPDVDAHVMIIAEQLPVNTVADMDRFVDVVLQNANSNGNSVQLISQGPLSPRIDSRFLHTRGRVNGMAMEAYFGLYARDRRIFQVMAFAPLSKFDSVSAELRQIVESFEVS